MKRPSSEPIFGIIYIYDVLSSNTNGFRQIFLTKGDNNAVTDEVLYPGDRTTVTRQEIRGFVRGFVPLLGWAVIGVQESAWVKYLVWAFVLVAGCLGI